MRNFKEHFLLNEGGVYGHMNYVYERLDFTFAELKDFFQTLISGRVDKLRITEKVDGQNIFFTWNESEQEPKYARNIGQIKKGGINFQELKTQFSGRGVVEQIFTEGGQQILDALYRLTPASRESIFGINGDRWVNAEIMHTAAPNVILYKGNHIVLHGMYIFDDAGDKTSVQGSVFDSLVEDLRVEISNWRILGPIVHKITNFDGLRGPYEKFCKEIDEIVSQSNLDSHNTIGDLIEHTVYNELISLNIPEDAAKLASRVVVDKESADINSLKKYVGPKLKHIISQYITQTEIRRTRSRIIEPIQRAATQLSIEVLRDLTSILVLDSKAEASRITNKVSELINKIYEYQDQFTQDRKEFISKEIAKHSNNIDSLLSKFQSPIEGIVVEYPPGSGNLLKITGAFGTINQILGLGQYGRGAIPPIITR